MAGDEAAWSRHLTDRGVVKIVLTGEAGPSDDRKEHRVRSHAGFQRAAKQALAELRRDPAQAVQAQVDDLTVELRAVTRPPAARSAADLFADIGPWEGETTEEVLDLLAEARRLGGVRDVSAL